MGWVLVEDTHAPAMRWQAHLTTATPATDWLSLALISDITVQAEGYFGTGQVRLDGSNSGDAPVEMERFRHTDIAPLLPVLFTKATLEEGDEHTDVLLTVVGRR